MDYQYSYHPWCEHSLRLMVLLSFWSLTVPIHYNYMKNSHCCQPAQRNDSRAGFYGCIVTFYTVMEFWLFCIIEYHQSELFIHASF